MSKLTLLRDAATYVYDEIWAGLSSGKDVYELMRDIKLPEEYAELSQQHGRVEWTVRETVNQAGAWFQYKYTSELYPYRPTVVYPELVELAGGVDNVLGLAQKQLKEAFESSCEKLECELLEVDGEQDHVHLHLLIAYPPKLAISVMVNNLKSTSSRRLRMLNTHLVTQSRSGRLWSRSYFACSAGGATIETLKEYVNSQSTPE